MTRLGLGLLALAILLQGGAACTPKPRVTSPADGSSVAASGQVPVTIELVQAPPAGGLHVKLLSGVDSPPSRILDVSSRFTVNGSTATGALGPADLGAGRNSLFASVDGDGDGDADVTASSTFSWLDMRAAACAEKITPVTPESPWKDDPGMPPVNHTRPTETDGRPGQIWMAGFGMRNPDSFHDHLWARGVVIESRGKKIAVVVLDLIGYFNNEVETARTLVPNASSYDAILVASTHQHEGPDAMGLWGPTQVSTGVSLQYLDFVNQTIANCIADAASRLEPAEIKFVTTDTSNTSRPPWTDLVADGGVLQRDCVRGAFDPQGNCPPPGILVEGDAGPVINAVVPAFQIRNRSTRATIATLVNFASHPESLGSDNLTLTSDFPHFMREALEQRYGGTAIYLSADLGVLQGPLDVDLDDPVNPSQMVPRRTFEFAQVMGEILADRAGDALDVEARYDLVPAIQVASSKNLPGQNPLYVDVPNLYFRFGGLAGVFARRPVLTGAPTPSGFAALTEVMAIRIGQAQIAVTPNELDPQIGALYRAQMTGAQHRFIAGLGNDEIGYQLEKPKFDPTCFLCFNQEVFGDPAGCPTPNDTRCETYFVNNIGPDADPQLQGIMSALLSQLNP